jgi:predicted aspartyl protease
MGRHIYWSLSFGLLFTCAAVSARSNTPVNVLPFKIYGQQLIVVQGSIGSLEKRNLIVDTGAYPTVIDAAIAQKLSLSGHREELDAVDRTVSSMAVIVPGVEIGPVHATNVRSLVQDLSDVSRRAGLRIDGLIGIDVLSRSSFVIDYGAKKISFGPIHGFLSSIPFAVANGKLCVDVHAGENSVRLMIDTGAEKLVLFGSHVPWLPSSDRARAFTNLAGSFVMQEVRLDTLQLGDTNLGAEPVYVSARPIPIYSFDGFLSTIQFRLVAFDFERNQFGWITKEERKHRVNVASKSKGTPPFAAALANRLTKPKESLSVPAACGTAPDRVCSLQ